MVNWQYWIEVALTPKAMSPTTERMGRESLGVKGFYVWLFEGQPEAVDALVGKQKRSEFIREAIRQALDRELKRRERQKGTDR